MGSVPVDAGVLGQSAFVRGMPSGQRLHLGRRWSQTWSVRLVQLNGVVSGRWGGRGLSGTPHGGCSPGCLWMNSASVQ